MLAEDECKCVVIYAALSSKKIIAKLTWLLDKIILLIAIWDAKLVRGDQNFQLESHLGHIKN